MKTSVIIGRFQIDQPHGGHRWLLDKVMTENMSVIDSKLVILVGCNEALSDRNPLDFATRYPMLREEFGPQAHIYSIYDHPDDKIWSQRVDERIKDFENITLYCSKDGFKKHYHGRHPVIEFAPVLDYSAVDVRKEIGQLPVNSRNFRKGVIYATERRFPTAYPTVDIALLRQVELIGEYETTVCGPVSETFLVQILLGRKPGRDKWCFPGGFVDPTDVCLESAAHRELSEEVVGVQTHEFKYIASHKVNDHRYRGSKDGIITSLFVTWYMGGNLQAGDDLEEIKWVNLDRFPIQELSENHHVLYNSLTKYLQNAGKLNSPSRCL